MNIALIGFGKMGQAIAQCIGADHVIALIVDPDHAGGIGTKIPSHAQHSKTIAEANWKNIDVAIEFSHPSAALENIQALCERGINTVVGTTGWHGQTDQVRAWVEQAGTGLIWGSNFSIGVQLFWKTLEHAAKLFNAFDEFDVFGHEFHHREKADSPSGTARTAADILIKTLDRKTELAVEKIDGKPRSEQLHFSSTRGGFVPGTHSVYFDSPADTLEITHTARSREGFARGALRCAEWIQDKKGFFFVEDYLADLLHSKNL